MPKIKNRILNSYFIELCNKLSNINQYITYPNPCVGAVLAGKNNYRVAFTGKNGSPHAENKLLQKINIGTYDTLYTSLEPCCHKGKNPPCTDMIIKKKIKLIYTSSQDQDVRVKNITKNILKKNKIKIKYTNKSSKASLEHNYSSKSNMPFVHAKIAVSRDYYTKHKQKRLFTSLEALKFAHLKRYQSDSILIGRKTLNDDNPKLTVRLKGLEKNIKKFVINPNLIFKKNILKNKFMLNSYVFHECRDVKLVKKYKKIFKLIFVNFNNKKSCEIILKKIYKLGFRKILIEGGMSTLKHFLDANLVNELAVVKNKENFKKFGLLNAKQILHFHKKSPYEIISLEDDTIMNYKL